MPLPQTIAPDPLYPGFADDLQKLSLSHPQLYQFFASTLSPTVKLGQFEKLASPRLAETAFNGAYELYKLSYLNGQLEIYARLDNDVLAFMTILKP
jgi:hypothetical protein